MGETPWIAWCRMAHARPLPLAALADVARLEAVCPVCAAWNDGDPACPAHRGTYQGGMICPLGGEGDILVVCMKGAAYICFTCLEAAEAR